MISIKLRTNFFEKLENNIPKLLRKSVFYQGKFVNTRESIRRFAKIRMILIRTNRRGLQSCENRLLQTGSGTRQAFWTLISTSKIHDSGCIEHFKLEVRGEKLCCLFRQFSSKYPLTEETKA